MRQAAWVVLAVSLVAQAQQKGSKAEPGVNWEGQVLRATGAGAPDLKASNPAQARLGAERTAKLDALRNLLEQARGIRISAERTVGDALAGDEVRGRVEGALRGYRVVDKRYYSDGGVELEVEVPLAAIAAVVVPAAGESKPVTGSGEKKYTGLVVDARGLGLEPVLAPRLLDAAGQALYGADAVSAEARASAGVAGWSASLDEAKKAARVGTSPLVLKADRREGSDLVLAKDAVQQLSEADTRFLAEGRVIIVTR